MNKMQIFSRLLPLLQKAPWQDAERGQWVTEVSDDGRVALSCTGDGSSMRAIVAVVGDCCEMDLIGIAEAMIGDPESWGWGDVDAVIWDVQIGHDFHGIPAEMHLQTVAEMMGRFEETKRGPFFWVSVHCSDHAS